METIGRIELGPKDGFRVSSNVPGLLSNQGEKSINFYSIVVPLRKKYKLVFHNGSSKKNV